MEIFFKFILPIFAAIAILIPLVRPDLAVSRHGKAVDALAFFGSFFLFFGSLLIAGIISWFSSGSTLILQSFLYSLISFFGTIFLYTTLVTNRKNHPTTIKKEPKQADKNV